MFCVIQKVQNRKPNPYGAHKELKVTTVGFTIEGVKKIKYGYSYGEERFERPIKDIYNISIHKSYRENGKVKKMQFYICKMSYYDLINIWPGDCINGTRLKEKLQEIGISEEELWDLVYEKLNPLVEQVKAEFEQTEEFKVSQEHKTFLEEYRKKKKAFEEKYGAASYDYCYDIFGELRNADELARVTEKTAFERLKEEEEQRQRQYQSYKDSYNNWDFSSLLGSSKPQYTDEEKNMLKKIYRASSKQFHPDVAGGDESIMKFLTKLKDQWGI